MARGFGRWVVPLLALALFVNYVDRGALGTAAPLIKDELRLDATQLGLLLSAFSWTYVAATPLAGWLTERIGAGRTMAAGLAVWSAATLLTGFAGGFAAIFALRLALGVGEAASFPCSTKLIAERVPRHRLGAANALMTQGLSFGPAFGVLTGGLLMASLGWRRVFMVFGAVSLLWLVPWLLGLRRLGGEAGGEAPAPGPAPAFREILRKRELWGLSLGHLAGSYAFYFVISWLPLYLVKARGFSLREMAMLGAGIYLAFAAAAYLSGWLTDRWIEGGATQGRARKTAAAVSHLLGIAGLLVTAFGGREAAVAGLALTAFGFGVVNPHTFAAAQVMAGPRAAGKWMGVQNALGNLSGIVGPLVTGALIDRTGGFTAAFLVTAGVALAGLIGWLLMIPRMEPLAWE